MEYEETIKEVWLDMADRQKNKKELDSALGWKKTLRRKTFVCICLQNGLIIYLCGH